MTGRQQVGGVLLLAAIVGAVVGMLLWANETHRVERANESNAFTAAIAADSGSAFPAVHEDPRRSTPIAIFVFAGGAGLFGMLLIATSPGREEAADPKAGGDA
jgi:O-antigen ligase